MRSAGASVQMGSRALADGVTVVDMGEKTTANVLYNQNPLTVVLFLDLHEWCLVYCLRRVQGVM